MNRINKAHTLLYILITLPGIIAAQVDFMEVSTENEMEQAQKKAAEQDLYLFVDVYAVWCGPCKMMDRDVYTDPAVSAYMNTNFVSVRMDGEKDFGRKFAARNQLEGYPTMFIFDPEGEYISKIVGFTQSDQLVSSLTGIVDNYAEVNRYRELSDSRKLDEKELAEYIEALRMMGTDGEAKLLASMYISDIKKEDFSDEDISVIAHYLCLDDGIWATFSADPERLRRVLGDKYVPAMEQIYNTSLVKAVEEDNIKLISLMANELAPLLSEEKTNSWDLRSLPFLQFYYYTEQLDELITYVDNRFESDRKDDHRWLFGAASMIVDMDQQYRTEELMTKGMEWFRICIDLEEQFDYFFYLGMAQFFILEREESKISFMKAKALAEDEEQLTMVNQVLQFFEEQ